MSDDLAARLRTLRSGSEGRSQTARLADYFDDVERTLQAGVSRAAILEQLHEVGFSMSMKAFDVAMYRLRKRRDRQLATATHGLSRTRLVTPTVAGRGALAKQRASQPVANDLPEDWRTCPMTAEQTRALSPEQRKERRAALQEIAFPTLRPLEAR